ncbi:hypothetical protein BUALT_Bualt04G0009000 [Buddleja alternifolia]|uniref:Uncharacterized protein n=1 Tax=Buddleja alternifolia TaxID=168488 RepID=A0AAV6XLM8_9LAMI|nr:hypothetical protein BUALT_Bualt04G0009000 [Buddleja alternifolia]
MVNRRFTHVGACDDNDNGLPPPSHNPKGNEEQNKSKCMEVHLPDKEQKKLSMQNKNKKKQENQSPMLGMKMRSRWIKTYGDNKQHENDIFVQKTLSLIGDLPDLEREDDTVDHEDKLKNKNLLRKGNMSTLDVSRDEDDGVNGSQSLKAKSIGCTVGSAS